jgi:hypothetical protein
MATNKKKVRRFQEGGFSAEQEEWLGGADRTDPYILARMRSAIPDKPKSTSRDFDAADDKEFDYSTPLAKASFKEAFADARGAGDKSFEYMGKKYTTDMAKSTPKATPKPAAESPEEYKARMDALVKKQAIERVEPENYIPGTGLLKNLLKRGMKTIGPPKQIGNQPTKMLPYRKSADAKKADAEASGAMKGDVRGEELRYKKGGAVKNSASRRADGCAIRGKTRA